MYTRISVLYMAIDRNIFRSEKNIWAVTIEMRGETRPRPHAQCPLLMPDFNQNRNIWGKKIVVYISGSRVAVCGQTQGQ
jgi:hypothetical protein